MKIKQISTLYLLLATNSSLPSALENEAIKTNPKTVAVHSEAEQKALDEALFSAGYDGKLEEVRELVRKGANVMAQDDCGRIPLHHAIRKTPVVQFLIAQAPDSVNYRDKQGYTPFPGCLYACGMGMISDGPELQQSARLLLTNGADPSIPNSDKTTSLHFAARITNTSLADFVFQVLTLKIAHTQDHAGKTPLHDALAYRNRHAVTALLAAGARTDIPDNRGMTPRDIAEKDGFSDWLLPVARTS